MKNCSSCGEPVGDSKFCSNCGQVQTCLSCGTEFTENEKFCTKCGTARGQSNQQLAQTSVTPSATTASSPEVATGKPLNNKRVPLIAGVIATIVVALFLVFKLFGSPDTPEEVIENFFKAFEAQDVEEIKEYMHPSEHDLVDFSDVPSDVKIEVVEFEEVDINGDEASVVVVAKMTSKSFGISETDDFEFELEKLDGKWVIVEGL